MVITLNLLPPQQRVALQHRQRQRRWAQLAFIIWLGVLLVGGTLGFLWWQLTMQHAQLTTELTELQANETRIPLSSLTKVLQTELSLVRPVSNPALEVAKITNDVVGKLPSGIHLTNVVINTTEKTLGMSGQADTRDAFLEMQSQLTSSPWLENVDIPRSGLVQREAIPFSLTATLKTP